MLFTTWQYALFLPLVLLVYYALSHRWQNRFLLLASYFFYGCWDWRFLLLLMFSTCTDYWCGRGVAVGTARQRKLLVIVTLCINLTILGFFKYFNFFVDSAGWMLARAGMHPHLPILRVILPVGVSFYTFQSIAYVVDVYRGEVEAEKDFVLYALFVSYFPQLVAGPIERACHMLPQYRQQRIVTEEMFQSGLLLILIGLFKKLAIADPISAGVQEIFADPHKASAVILLKGIWLFSLQIYCDFSGYTDIARGTSRLLGIELMENFNQPYFSANITEFWRRWHISLSSWLRDYLYIPLGGNRHGTFNTYRNLLLTMILGGLWHGASWTFVIWGTLHGLYLSAHKFFLHLTTHDGKPRQLRWGVARVLLTLATFHLVMLTWVFFRAADFHTAMAYLRGIATLRGGLHGVATEFQAVAFYVLLIVAIDIPQYVGRSHTVMLRWPWALRGAAAGAMVVLIVLLAPNHDTPFIYFQF